MTQIVLRQARLCLFVLTTGVMFTSCVSTREAVLFNDLPASTQIAAANIPEQRIGPNDILSINVGSINQEAAALFNTPVNPAMVYNSNNLPLTGYLVNPDGYIQFPVLGKIKAAGLTKAELENNIRSTLESKELLKDPSVSIRYLNFRVTVLGEVGHPTVVQVPNEKISLLEALGMAGDLTLYAKRDNVLLIREENNQKIVNRINLSSPAFMSSPYYYLKSNDVIYVEPNKAKVASTTNTRQLLPAILSGLSFLAIIIDRATR